MEDMSKIVYVVDDDEIFHFIIKKMLGQQSNHLVVTSFLCAEEALEQLSSDPQPTLPSLIILDMNMQRMNGWDFIEAYRGAKNISQKYDSDYHVLLLCGCEGYAKSAAYTGINGLHHQAT